MYRLLSTTWTMLFIALTAFAAHAGLVTDVDVLEYGLYTYDEKVVMMERRHEGAKLSNIRLLKETLDIPVGAQTFFGIKYVLHAADNAKREIVLELRVTTPEGETSKGSITALTGVPTTTNIEFTEKDTAGVYLFQVIEGDEVLLSKKINVSKP